MMSGGDFDDDCTADIYHWGSNNVELLDQQSELNKDGHFDANLHKQNSRRRDAPSKTCSVLVRKKNEWEE